MKRIVESHGHQVTLDEMIASIGDRKRTEQETREFNSVILLVDGLNGIYVPQRFGLMYLRTYGSSWTYEGIFRSIPLDPRRDDYWDNWEDVLRLTIMVDYEGRKYRLHQNQDLWAYALDAQDSLVVRDLLECDHA